VGRTPWSAAGPLAGLFELAQNLCQLYEAGQGAGRGPGGPPHYSQETKWRRT